MNDLDVLVVAFFLATLAMLGSAILAVLGFIGSGWMLLFFILALIFIGASGMTVE